MVAMTIDVDALIGLEVTQAMQQVEQDGGWVKVIIEGQAYTLEGGINRVVLIVRDDRVVKPYWG